MDLTLAEIAMGVRRVQLRNASPPMLVTLFGIVTLVKLWQPSKANSPMRVTPWGIT